MMNADAGKDGEFARKSAQQAADRACARLPRYESVEKPSTKTNAATTSGSA